jgi:hypothetical protein
MSSRSEIHETFVARFHHGKKGKPATDKQLDSMESDLDAKVPAAYREFMTCHGAVHTPSILDELSDKEMDHVDIQELFTPAEAVKNTKLYWSGGMPDNVIGFASDCMGNMIGFRRQRKASDDAPVMFFDHEFVEVRRIAPTFDKFLAWYLDHLDGNRAANG